MPAQYRAIWTVPGGGTGYSVLHFTEAASQPVAQTIADQVQDFFTLLVGPLPDDVNISFDSEVLDLSEAGVLMAVWPVTAPTNVAGASASVYSRAAGGRIDWGTDQIVAGRRLSGRTYIVPLVSTAFDTVGLITAVSQGVLQTAANGLIADTSFNRPLRVWSRTHGVSAVVESASVPPKGAILRGRRD